MPSRVSAQSTTNTLEDKCSVELNKQNPGMLHSSLYSSLHRERESQSSLSVTMADKPKWRHPDCPASCFPKTAPPVDRVVPEASSDASPKLIFILLEYRNLDERISKAKAATLPLFPLITRTSPPTGFDASHKHRDNSHLCLSLLTSSGVMAAMTILVWPDQTYLCLIVNFPPLLYSNSPPLPSCARSSLLALPRLSPWCSLFLMWLWPEFWLGEFLFCLFWLVSW